MIPKHTNVVLNSAYDIVASYGSYIAFSPNGVTVVLSTLQSMCHDAVGKLRHTGSYRSAILRSRPKGKKKIPPREFYRGAKMYFGRPE